MILRPMLRTKPKLVWYSQVRFRKAKNDYNNANNDTVVWARCSLWTRHHT